MKTLTENQCKVVKALSEGKNTKEIAFEFGLSPKTIEFHSLNARRKIGVYDIANLTRWALKAGISALVMLTYCACADSTFPGTLTADKFRGDGSALTGISGGQTNISYTAVTNAPWAKTNEPGALYFTNANNVFRGESFGAGTYSEAGHRVVVTNGGIGGARFVGGATPMELVVDNGSLGGMFANDVANTTNRVTYGFGYLLGAGNLTMNGGLGYLFGGSAQNILEVNNGISALTMGSDDTSVTNNRSLLVGRPQASTTNTYESTVAVLGVGGQVVGFDTNSFFQNGVRVSLVAALTNNDTRAITFSNAVYSGASSALSAPTANELPTAGWVRGLFAGAGVSYYASTNIAAGITNIDMAGGSNFVFTADIPSYNFTRAYTTPANGTYFGSVTTTNKFLQINSGVTVNSYLSVDSGGSGTAGPAVKPEIYVSYNGTNWFGDWDGPTQNIPEGGTNLYAWVVSNPQYISTNATGFYVQRRFKMVTQPTPSASTVTFHGGTNWKSHITLSAADSSSGNAYLAANNTFTGSNTFAQPIVGSGSGLTNVNAEAVASGVTNQWKIDATNALATASFTDFVLSGTNVVISPTNGNLQSWVTTNTSWAALDAANTNFTETIRLNIYASNTVTWTTSNLSNYTANATSLSNATTVLLFDHFRNTNLWWAYRLR
jgi:DNA-binding CsgD family transcriptional regulator